MIIALSAATRTEGESPTGHGRPLRDCELIHVHDACMHDCQARRIVRDAQLTMWSVAESCLLQLG